MNYTLEIDITLPRSKVVELYQNSDHWPNWQESFISSQPIEGTPGETGSKTKLIHRVGGRKTEMVETIESNNLPAEMTCIYEATGAWNRVVNQFIALSPQETCWVFETEFRCRGVLRILAYLMPSMFRHASLKDMKNFKKFAESRRENAQQPQSNQIPKQE